MIPKIIFAISFAILLHGKTQAQSGGSAPSPKEATSEATSEATQKSIQSIAQTESTPRDPVALAAAIWSLQQSPDASLDQVLAAINDAGPTATNRLIGVASSMIRKQNPTLRWRTDYVADRQHPAAARTLVFRTLQSDSNPAATEWMDSFLDTATDDPAAVLRRLAIDVAIEQARQQSTEDPDAAKEVCRQVLGLARHPSQVAAIAAMLRQMGDPITTAEAMSMIMRWHIIGPFDNVGGVGFDAQFPPQMQYVVQSRIDLDSTFEGKTDRVAWSEIVAADDGIVDLHTHFEQEKGATAYAYVSLQSEQSGPAQIRLQSITANKVWVNGQRKMINAVSHSGSAVDQYIADFDLKLGENTILLKLCQNEQTERWAQKWEFQCRITDPTGKGIDLQ